MLRSILGRLGQLVEYRQNDIWLAACAYSEEHLGRFAQMPVLEAVEQLQGMLYYLWVRDGLLEDSEEARVEFLASWWRPQIERRTMGEYRFDLGMAIALFEVWAANKGALPNGYRPDAQALWRFVK